MRCDDGDESSERGLKAKMRSLVPQILQLRRGSVFRKTQQGVQMPRLHLGTNPNLRSLTVTIMAKRNFTGRREIALKPI